MARIVLTDASPLIALARVDGLDEGESACIRLALAHGQDARIDSVSA